MGCQLCRPATPFPGNFIASIFGTVMYFATLTEVPIIRAFMDMGMGKGPALALLLAGPSLSLPSMITLSRIMGIKKTAAICRIGNNYVYDYRFNFRFHYRIDL